MVHWELNLNPEIEKQLIETINIAFNGSYEKFIENSLTLIKLDENREDIRLATEAIERLEKGESYTVSLDELAERLNGLGGYFIEWDCGADLSVDNIEAHWEVIKTILQAAN